MANENPISMSMNEQMRVQQTTHLNNKLAKMQAEINELKERIEKLETKRK